MSGTSTTIPSLNGGTSYQVQLRATNDEGDGPWSPPGSGRTNVTGNDPPVFPGTSTTRSFDENTAAGEPVGAPVTADDADTLAYSLEGPDASSFTIVRASGQIRTRSRVTYDFETRDTYTVAVKATDPHQISDTITVTIRLDDVLEPPDAPAAPRVSSESINSVSVSWNPPSNNRGRPPIIDYALQYRPCPDGQCPDDPEEDWEDGPQNVADTTDIIMELTTARGTRCGYGRAMTNRGRRTKTGRRLAADGLLPCRSLRMARPCATLPRTHLGAATSTLR